MLHTDTIAAAATPPGSGGIGIVRISGREAKAILSRVFLPLSPRFENFRPWTLHRGKVVDQEGLPLDDALAVFMPGPRTFTGEDVAEVHCHGGQALMREVLEAILDRGARLAERGEFSRRALLNGRMDLTQAEAVAEMIAAPTKAALRLGSAKLDGLLGQRVSDLRARLEKLRRALCVAVDFPEEEVECLNPDEFAAVADEVRDAVEALLRGHERCRCWQEGASVVLAGAVNAGKSSLLNALLGHNRALVTDVPGTTRDFLEEYVNLDGLVVRITDTAGLREAEDEVERLGVARSRERIQEADALVLVLDGARGLDAVAALEQEGASMLARGTCIVVWNKVDLAPEMLLPDVWREKAAACVAVSALRGTGLEELGRALRKVVLHGAATEPDSGELAPNVRQARLLREASEELRQLAADIRATLPYDVCAVRLDVAVSQLGRITGLDTSDEMLDHIFSTFCIGK